jgi:hypothetical protein
MSLRLLALGLTLPLSLDAALAAGALASPSRTRAAGHPRQGPTVRWDATHTAAVHDTTVARLTLHIDAGWHVYALTQEPSGPYPLRIRSSEDSGWQLRGAPRGPAPERQPTSVFGIPVEWYNSGAVILVPLERHGRTLFRRAPRLAVRYQACSATLCLPPTQVEVLSTEVAR